MVLLPMLLPLPPPAAAAAAAAATGSPTAAWISKDTVPHMVGYLKWVRDEFTIILRY
jgi:hypothetical protein